MKSKDKQATKGNSGAKSYWGRNEKGEKKMLEGREEKREDEKQVWLLDCKGLRRARVERENRMIEKRRTRCQWQREKRKQEAGKRENKRK